LDAGVDVPIDLAGVPVHTEGQPETLVHVGAGQPPTADIEPQWRDRLWAVQVVVPPEAFLVGIAFPVDREGIITEEGGVHVVGWGGLLRHGCSSLEHICLRSREDLERIDAELVRRATDFGSGEKWKREQPVRCCLVSKKVQSEKTI
jgi:hypothetical protein